MNKKDYSEPRSMQTGSALRVSLLAGSPVTKISEGTDKPNVETNEARSTEQISGGGKEDNPLWN